MNGVDQGRLARSLEAISFGTTRTILKARDAREPLALGEGIQSCHIPISGSLTPGSSIVSVPVNFEYVFYSAPSQRFNALTRPQFSWGFAINRVNDSDPVPLILMHAMCEFDDTDEDVTPGAIIHLCSFVLDNGQSPDDAYSGVLHATFTGYGSASEDETAGTE